METDHEYVQRELRFLIEAGASVEVTKNGRKMRASTVNMSGSGVLLNFQEQVDLAVGDQVMGEFRIAGRGDDSLPYWALGNIVRIEECRVAIMFKGGGFSPLDSESGMAKPLEI